MAKRGALSSNARRALVISFVNQGLVRSQNDLVELLADEGVEVTQATASRDLDDVGAVRGKDENGTMKYQFLSFFHLSSIDSCLAHWLLWLQSPHSCLKNFLLPRS